MIFVVAGLATSSNVVNVEVVFHNDFGDICSLLNLLETFFVDSCLLGFFLGCRFLLLGSSLSGNEHLGLGPFLRLNELTLVASSLRLLHFFLLLLLDACSFVTVLFLVVLSI